MKERTLIVFFALYSLFVFADDNRPLLDKNDYQMGKKFDYFFLESLRLQENNNHSDAFNTLLYALKIDSTSSAALVQLSDYYLFLQQDSLAVDALQKAVKYSPKNFEYKISLAGIHREMKNIPEAIRLYEELVAENPDKSELNYYLSDLYLNQNQIDKAIKSLDALENNIGMNEALSMEKYKLYLSTEQKEKALKEIERLAAKYPLEAKYQTMIGDFYLDQDQTDKALEHYHKAYTVDPQNPYYVMSMANYYEKQGETETATLEIEKALKNVLLDVDTKIAILGKYIGNLLQNKKDVNAANMLFETLMEQHSQETELNMMYGQFLIAQDKREEAKFQFQIVTEARPENMPAWRQLLKIALKEENTDDIVTICNNAIIYFPDASEFYFYKGSALLQKKELEEALTVFLQGIQYVPAEEKKLLSTFYGQIGDLYHQLGRKTEAYETYEKSLEYNENNIPVLNNYAYFLSLDKIHLDKAEQMSSKCVKSSPNNSTYIDTYAWVFFQIGNYRLAKFYIESALSNGGEKSADILEHYGDILFKTGDPDKAVQQWKKALEMKKDENTNILKKKIANKMYYETEE